MRIRDFHNLRIGDHVFVKGRLAKVAEDTTKDFFTANLIRVKYVDTCREVYKNYRQVKKVNEKKEE